MVKVCLSFMDQMRGFWEACKLVDGDAQGGSLVLLDSTEALHRLLTVEQRLSLQIRQAVDSAMEWCRLANACVQGMKAWELADRGESMVEFKGKREMFEMLRKLHGKVQTAVQVVSPGMVVVTGMPVSRQEDGDENIEHLLMVLARTNEEYALEALKYVGAATKVDGAVLEELVTGMGMMRQGLEETGNCLQKLVDEVRDAARIYEASAELLGGLNGSDDDDEKMESEGKVSLERKGEKHVLRRLVDLYKMVDALL